MKFIIMNRLLGVVTIILGLMCCSSTPPQITADKKAFTGCKNIALRVISSDFDVCYSRDTNLGWADSSMAGVGIISILNPVAGLGAALVTIITKTGVEPAYLSSQDNKITESFAAGTEKEILQELLGHYFLEEMTGGKLLKISKADAKSNEVLLSEGYDKVIVLKIEELQLNRGTDYMKKYYLYANIWAEMVNLEDNVVIWRKNEILKSNEYVFSDFKTENGKLLLENIDNIFKKAAVRLASDIIYRR